jgi:multidrug efflux pump subunit AcrA (membrane-fusion protein)
MLRKLRNALLRKPSIRVAVALVGMALLFPLQTAAADQTEAPALTVSLQAPAKREWPETVPASGWL